MGEPQPFTESLIERIRRLHTGPDRGYHGWSHPTALMELHSEVKDSLHDPGAVLCAILMHDAIYEPRSKENERRSADLARQMFKDVLSPASLDHAVRMIEATAAHAIPPGLPPEESADMAIFLDMDLSILGASPEAFDAYEAGVRHEYRSVPEFLFRRGRAEILEKFLARDVLYLSPWGRERFEAKARENLKRSIAQLAAKE